MSSMKNLTAIIITFLRPEYLKVCVKSLRETYPDINIIVGENGKENKEIKNFLKDYNAKYIVLPFDSGVCGGRNRLIKEVKTPYVLVGDDDFKYTKGAMVDRMLTFMENNKNIDLIGGRIIQDNKILNYQGYFNLGSFYNIYSPVPEDIEYKKDKKSGLSYTPVDITFNYFVAKTKLCKDYPWDENIKVSYEHSVKGDTPIIIKNIRKDKEFIDVKRIDELIPESLSNPVNSYRYKPHSNLLCWTEVGWRKIKSISMHKNTSRMCKIQTRKSFIECTEDHSLVIKDKPLTPNELSIGDKIEHISFPKLTNEIDVDKDWAWFMGYFLAEGSCLFGEKITSKGNKTGSYKISITNQNIKELNYCIKTLNKFGIFAKVINTKERKDKCKFLHIEDNNKYKDIFLEFYNPNKEKVIPSGVFRWNKESRISFLNGFLAGDGSKKDKALFIQKSKVAVQGLLLLTSDLYKYYSLYRQSNKYGKWFSVQLGNEINRERKKSKDLIEKKTYYNYDGFVYDIEIDDDKHTFSGGIGNVNLHNSDWFISLYKAKKKVVYSPNPVVIHKPAGVVIPRQEEYSTYRLRQRDKKYFYKKHGIKFNIDMNKYMDKYEDTSS